MGKKFKIYEQGVEKAPRAVMLFSNLVILLLVALGTVACWFFHPYAALLYLAFTVIMVYVVLKKVVCTNCYYYDKLCSFGWGKLSSLLFKKGRVEDFNTSIGLKVAMPPICS